VEKETNNSHFQQYYQLHANKPSDNYDAASVNIVAPVVVLYQWTDSISDTSFSVDESLQLVRATGIPLTARSKSTIPFDFLCPEVIPGEAGESYPGG